MSSFKTILLTVFIAAAVIGVLIFSGLINLGGSSSTSTTIKGSVAVWGTVPSLGMSAFLQEYNLRNQDIHVSYQQKDEATFASELVEAIASGEAPDLVLLPDSLLGRFSDKLVHIPYDSLPARTFQDTFVSGANIFSASDGTVALPWAADPLVMYYNRDILEQAGIVTPPATWKAFGDSIQSLTKRKPDLTLIQSGAALGAFNNISHAKDIIALLFLENGNPFITPGNPAVPHISGGGIGSGDSLIGQQVMKFYMGFSDPVKDIYSWNAGQPLDRTLFTQSSLAYFFGSTSDLPALRKQNPNLNFDVAFPPTADNGAQITTGRMYGLAIPKAAHNSQLSYAAATLLTSTDSEKALTEKAGTTLALMPVRRDVLASAPSSDPYLRLFYRATLNQKTWFDPSPADTDMIFSSLVKDIASGILSPDQALNKAASQIGSIVR